MSFLETPYGILKRLETVKAWTQAVAKHVGKSSLSILDYGCGTGDHVTYPLACQGHRVLGVDFHEASIREASRRYRLPNLSFQLAEIDALVKEGRQFDLVVCSEVLEHLHEPLRFLDAVHHLLPAGGGLIITTPNGYGSFEWLSSLKKTLERTGVHGLMVGAARRVMPRPRAGASAAAATCAESEVPSAGFLNMDSTHVQFFRIGQLERLFAMSGFRIVERRARTLLCGPYVDALFRLIPFEQALYRVNNRLGDVLPFAWAADWMFLLERRRAGAE
jgi:2-polyprenyl-3-methyl-5-hydroxy-6-metoxy-1,4-benzoquinol methylase